MDAVKFIKSLPYSYTLSFINDKVSDRTYDFKHFKSIAFDMDGVLVNLSEHVLTLYNTEFNDNVKTPGGWGWLNCKKADKKWFEELFNNPNTFFDAKPIDKMISAVRVLKELYDVSIVTICYPSAKIGKIAWIQKYMPFFDLRKVTVLSPEDANYKAFVDTDFLIDDNINNLKHFKGIPICFGDYEYNKGWSGVKFTNNNDLLNFFIKLYQQDYTVFRREQNGRS